MVTDREILEMFTDESKKHQAFEILLRQNQKPVYYYIRRMVLSHDDADDLTQNTFVSAWKALANFRGESKISTWLFRIAYHESINFLNAQKRLGKVALSDVEHRLGQSLQEDEHYQGDEIQIQLQTAIGLLPEKQKAVFVMKYFEEKRYDEIAVITGTSVGSLKASFHHAVQKIENFMKEVNPGD